jgi:chorismate synthase
MNNLGNFLTLSTFGESHGIAYGGIITNFPAGIEIDFEEIQHQLDRRKPGQVPLLLNEKRVIPCNFFRELSKENLQVHLLVL